VIRQLFSRRFLKFGAVGASGVGVNLVCLWLFADLLGFHANLASALAIEVSIISNFLLNEVWTFSDRKNGEVGLPGRALRFHMVSLLGAVIQWGIFVVGNVAWLLAIQGGAAAGSYFDGAGWVENYLYKPVAEPPEVGSLKYVSQLLGIGVATLWNFFANFYWTWKQGEGD
jgi:putative flippase GtrA